MIVPRRRCARGFSLVEVTLALGIAVFCLVVVFGLLSVALNTTTISVEQTNATNLLAAVASDLRTAPRVGSYPNVLPTPVPNVTAVYGWTIPVSVTTTPAPAASCTPILIDSNGKPPPTASPAPSVVPARAYQLNAWITPGVGRSATTARIMLSWPPSAPYDKAAGSVETVVALDRN